MSHSKIRPLHGAFALASLLAVAACGSPASSDTTSDTLPTEDTQNAELPAPGDDTTPGDDTGTTPAGTIPVGDDAGAPGADGAAPANPTPPGSAPATPMPYRGINLAGGEFGSAIPGVEGRDYGFPTTAEVDYYMSKGMNTFRMGFVWERMQPTANGAFNETYEAHYAAVVAYATSKGARVILNPHNFARYYGNPVGSTQVPNEVFANFWGRLAAKWAANPNVMFNLVNEPHDISTAQWVGAANAAIAAIRAAGATNTIVVPGASWTGAHSWSKTDGYGSTNAAEMLKIVDPGHNFLIEAHQYLDANSGGGGGECVSATIGSERLAGWVQWLRDNHLRGIVGEFAGGDNAMCNAAVTNMMTYMMANSDVIDGWLWWAGGPMWGNYVFTLEPSAGKDRPQMALLTPFLQAP